MLWGAIVVAAQAPMHNLTRAQIDSIMNPTLHAEAVRMVLADKLSYDLGQLAETDNPVSRTFSLRNVSDKAMRIGRVRTTCGCTAAAFDTFTFFQQ